MESFNCSLCKYVVSYVDAVIQTNKSKAAIESAMRMACIVLPQSLSQPCFKFIASYGLILVEYISKYDTSFKVCIAAKICSNDTQETLSCMWNKEFSAVLWINCLCRIDLAEKSKIKQQSVKSPQCSLCKLVVTYLELIVENNKTEAAIESALEKVCSILPKDKKTECIQFVDTYGTKLVELLEKLGSPKLVCLALGLCVTNTPKMAPGI